jgi:hypothetical protein
MLACVHGNVLYCDTLVGQNGSRLLPLNRLVLSVCVSTAASVNVPWCGHHEA